MILNTLNRTDNYTDQILQQHGYSRLQFTNLVNSAMGTSYNQENLVYQAEVVEQSVGFALPQDNFGLTNNFTCYSGTNCSFTLGIISEELGNQSKTSTNLGTRVFNKFISSGTNFVSFSQFKFV